MPDDGEVIALLFPHVIDNLHEASGQRDAGDVPTPPLLHGVEPRPQWSGAANRLRGRQHQYPTQQTIAFLRLPAIAYAGRPFFRSAWRALSARSLNMDVPISLAVILASCVSLHETATHGEHAWFDASIGLLFFLLVGRCLDHRMRDVARSAAARLLSLSARSAKRLEPDGTSMHVPIGEVAPNDIVQVTVGERVPVDGVVLEGVSDIDRAMLTGESDPEPIAGGGKVFAGRSI